MAGTEASGKRLIQLDSEVPTCNLAQVLRGLRWMRQSFAGTDGLQEFCLILFFLVGLGCFGVFFPFPSTV